MDSVWLGSLTLLSLPLPMPSTTAGHREIGAHRAAPCASAAVTPASVGSHHAGDIVAAVVFYNVGVLNTEVTGKNWEKTLTGKAAKLACDIDAMFASDHGIEVVLLSEFGNMYACIDDKWKTAKPVGSTQLFFEAIVNKLNLNEDIVVYALPPYVSWFAYSYRLQFFQP